MKINQIDKAEEFYQKNFFTSNEEIEAVCAEAKMHNVKVASHTSGGPSITTAVRFFRGTIK